MHCFLRTLVGVGSFENSTDTQILTIDQVECFARAKSVACAPKRVRDTSTSPYVWKWAINNPIVRQVMHCLCILPSSFGPWNVNYLCYVMFRFGVDPVRLPTHSCIHVSSSSCMQSTFCFCHIVPEREWIGNVHCAGVYIFILINSHKRRSYAPSRRKGMKKNSHKPLQ